MEYKLSSFDFSENLEREEKHYAIVKINSFRSACPSDARFSGSFSKENNEYSGSVKVLFSKGEFAASAKSDSIESLMDVLQEKIHKQIEAWRQTRFEQEDTFVNFQNKTGTNT